MLETTTPAPTASADPAVYRPRRPAATLLHRTVRRHLESYLAAAGADDDEPRSAAGRLAARCWALLLARIYECLPLLCPRCGEPMRIIAFILDPPVIERTLIHIGEPTTAPAVLPARAPPQSELSFAQVDPEDRAEAWPEIDQTGGQDGWD